MICIACKLVKGRPWERVYAAVVLALFVGLVVLASAADSPGGADGSREPALQQQDSAPAVVDPHAADPGTQEDRGVKEDADPRNTLEKKGSQK